LTHCNVVNHKGSSVYPEHALKHITQRGVNCSIFSY